MSDTPIVLVVPTLNSHHCLPDLVASLERQTWPHWQVLLIDGGSQDGTVGYLRHLCAEDPRFRWQGQEPRFKGIYGAMNQGMERVAANPAWSQAWVLFWGSDDWAASPQVLGTVANHLDQLAKAGRSPDLLVCRARYAKRNRQGQLVLGRRSTFRLLGSYRWSVFLGRIPPHQGTLFGPTVRRRLPSYAGGFDLSADLDYFLRLSCFADASVDVLPLDLVEMASTGVSGQRNQQRFREVKWAYQRRYGPLWWISYGLRYLKRGLDAGMAALPSLSGLN
jgi:glycosyltransferase involved in cell wall biosynthesis